MQLHVHVLHQSMDSQVDWLSREEWGLTGRMAVVVSGARLQAWHGNANFTPHNAFLPDTIANAVKFLSRHVSTSNWFVSASFSLGTH